MFDNLKPQAGKSFSNTERPGKDHRDQRNIYQKKFAEALIDADVVEIRRRCGERDQDESNGHECAHGDQCRGGYLTKVTNDELTSLMGGQGEDIKIEGNPAVILIAGLQGSGKTTFSGKLASYLKRQGRSVLLTACDIYRPAAIDQLGWVNKLA